MCFCACGTIESLKTDCVRQMMPIYRKQKANNKNHNQHKMKSFRSEVSQTKAFTNEFVKLKSPRRGLGLDSSIRRADLNQHVKISEFETINSSLLAFEKLKFTCLRVRKPRKRGSSGVPWKETGQKISIGWLLPSPI